MTDVLNQQEEIKQRGYDGIQNVRVIAEGFDVANRIIERIRPEHPFPWSELKKPSVFNRLSSFLLSFLS